MELPLELQAFIDREIGWKYKQLKDNARCCKNITKSEYMGTYFPRSFVESYKISELLLKNQFIKGALYHKNDLNILDIGSGTGGNLLGFLWYLKDINYFQENHDTAIYLRSIDGDSDSLEIQNKIIDRFFDQYVATDIVCQDFQSSGDAIEKLNEELTFQGQLFDIIMCSKFVNEFYSCLLDFQRNKGFYGNLVELVDDYLAEDGLFILTDITTPVYGEHKFWLPEIMSAEIKEIISEPDCGLTCIQPLSCAFFQNKCREPHRCFSQVTYEVKHNCLPNDNWQDNARICFKVLTKKRFANQVLSGETAQRGYIIAKKQDNNINTCIDQNLSAVSISNDAAPNSRRLNEAYGWYSIANG